MTYPIDRTMQPRVGITGILLAAGRGSRFDTTEDKLVQPCGERGEMVAVLAARHLLATVPVVAVVAAHGMLAEALQRTGCEVILADPLQPREMSATLRRAIAHASHAPGWLVALADMPLVLPATIGALHNALQAGADIAVPVAASRRGHPVGFSARHRDALLALRGDQGARAILASNAVTEVPVDDPGIFADIDTRADLDALGRIK